MLRYGQVPGRWSSEMLDVLLARFAPDGGGADGDGSGAGAGAGAGGAGDAGSGGETGSDGKPFDAARAQATIDTLRAEVKAGKATQKQLDDANARLKAIDDAAKTEGEKLAAKATEAEQKLTAATAQLAEERLGRIVERTATKLGFHDPDDAFALLNRSAVELDADGAPTNVEALLTALAKQKPHLVKAEGTPAPAAARGTPVTPKPNGKVPTKDEIIATTKDELKASGRYSF